MFPENRLGKWAVVLTLACMVLLLIFFLFETMGLILQAAIITELAAFILGIMAIRKERAILTYCALFLGIIGILFLLTHSLFIND
jgi:hypothetical protein